MVCSGPGTSVLGSSSPGKRPPGDLACGEDDFDFAGEVDFLAPALEEGDLLVVGAISSAGPALWGDDILVPSCLFEFDFRIVLVVPNDFRDAFSFLLRRAVSVSY